ncbi:hypothetical protein VARIO8X_90059 [Burkholderiales bacterium 8X]|nr:hypothetical protein VARIO8X_90059 [Burkholderiales bacterium 8X]
MTSNLERRLTALEADSVKAASSLTVRFMDDGGTPEEQAEHAALRASGVDLLVVNFVGATTGANHV